MRIAAAAGLLLLGLLIAAAGAWGAIALAVAGPQAELLRLGLAAGFGAASLAALVALALRRWRWRALVAYLALFAAALVWFFGIEPSNERDWLAENAVLPHATIDGDIVTVHNIRNFSYRTETDFTPAYYDKRFDLSKFEGVDLVASYWMGPDIAHIFLSFAFAGGDHLAISIEARKEKGEGYSTVKGFFRQYELYYVVADERDLIGVRTNHRKDPPEQVYVYRLQGNLDAGRRLFMEYADQINALAKRPAFYNTLTTNCTTMILAHTAMNPGHLPYSWKVLLSGFTPQYLYETGRLDQSVPFEEVRRRAHINAAAQAADQAPDFSRRIRR